MFRCTSKSKYEKYHNIFENSWIPVRFNCDVSCIPSSLIDMVLYPFLNVSSFCGLIFLFYRSTGKKQRSSSGSASKKMKKMLVEKYEVLMVHS